MGVMFAAAVAVLVLWRYRGLKLNIIKLYHLVFPVLMTVFLALPFATNRYTRGLAAGLYAVFSIGLMLTMLQSAQTSRDRGINPFYAFGTFGGIVYGMHDLGFILGSFLNNAYPVNADGAAPFGILCLYALGLVFFIVTVNWKNSAPQLLTGDSIELVASTASPVAPSRPNENDTTDAGFTVPKAAQPPANADHDSYDQALDRLQTQFALSEREREVVDLVARGLTVARIAEDLYISENTVRTHKKRIYTKLGVHKKQELIDLI